MNTPVRIHGVNSINACDKKSHSHKRAIETGCALTQISVFKRGKSPERVGKVLRGKLLHSSLSRAQLPLHCVEEGAVLAIVDRGVGLFFQK